MTAIHHNYQIICAIDIETTGLDHKNHDIVEIAIVPLDSSYLPHPGVMPLDLTLRPERMENIDYDSLARVGGTREKMAGYRLNGYDSMFAAELFESWFKLLEMPEGKRILPLAHNWPFERSFIQEWLGPKTFEYYFDGRYRDTMAFAAMMADAIDLRGGHSEYPKLNLGYLCTVLEVHNPRAHSALEDAVACAECYRRMLKRHR